MGDARPTAWKYRLDMAFSRAARLATDVLVIALALWAQAEVLTKSPFVWSGGRPVHMLLAAFATVPVLLRRSHPLFVICAVVGASAIQFEFGGGGLPQPFIAFVIALYAVAAYGSARDAILGGLISAAVILPLEIGKVLEGEEAPEDVIPVWLILTALWGFGRWIQHRKVETSELQTRTAFLELDREEKARTAVAEERARIARELHDLVAHSMGIIVVQAQAAKRVLHSDAAAADQALSVIASTGRQGLDEMRRLLGILRTSNEDDFPLEPQPSLRRLDALVADVRESGLPVEITVEGERRPLPPGVDLSAFRIIQEALTNALKYAGPAHAHVSVRYLPSEIEVEVIDDGAGNGAGSGSGHGLIGMRERVALYGGVLETQKKAEGGYLVRARLPLESEHA